MDMDELLGSPAAPRATIVSVAHLDDRQRRIRDRPAGLRVGGVDAAPTGVLWAAGSALYGRGAGHRAASPRQPAHQGAAADALQTGQGLRRRRLGGDPEPGRSRLQGPRQRRRQAGRAADHRPRPRARARGSRRVEAPRRPRCRRLVAGLGKREFLLTDVRAKKRRRDLLLALGHELSEGAGDPRRNRSVVASPDRSRSGARARKVSAEPGAAPPAAAGGGRRDSLQRRPLRSGCKLEVVVRNRITVQRKTVGSLP